MQNAFAVMEFFPRTLGYLLLDTSAVFSFWIDCLLGQQSDCDVTLNESQSI